MTKALRAQFEKELQDVLNVKLSAQPYIKIKKNKILIDNKNGTTADINISYLNTSREYTIDMFIRSSEIDTFIHHLSPPYPSNINNKDLVYFSHYGSEKNHSPFLLPTTANGREDACSRIAETLCALYLARAYNIIDLNKNLLSDVIHNASHYSYPALISLYAITKNNLEINAKYLADLLDEQALGFNNNKDVKMHFNNRIVNSLLDL